MTTSVKKVVVIGAGGGGREVVNQLHSLLYNKGGWKLEVVMVDRKEYGENTPAAVRTWVNDAYFHLLAANLKDMYTNYDSQSFSLRVETGEIQHITTKSVHLRRPNANHTYGEDSVQDELPFDALVIASGSHYPVWKGSVVTIDERREELQTLGKKISAANHVLIVGGGVSGVEVAGEILTENPEKHLTIIQSAKSLLPTSRELVGQLVQKKLLSFPNVRILFEQKVDLEEVYTHGYSGEDHQYQTNKGETVVADFAIVTAGNLTPNTQMLRSEEFANVLTETGHIKVLPTLQVEGYDNIFALGDVANINEAKLLANIAAQAKVVTQNLIRTLTTKTPSLATHKTGYTEPAIVIVGPNYGVVNAAFFGFGVHGGWVSSIKTKFVFEAYKPQKVNWK